jgi:hypothetical protein
MKTIVRDSSFISLWEEGAMDAYVEDRMQEKKKANIKKVEQKMLQKPRWL